MFYKIYYGGITMADIIKYPEHLVFGLDIGTRSIVGTVGYKEHHKFNVVAQYIKEHETRAMVDGQIHDIPKVSESISIVRHMLEQQIHRELKDVCIAAAGRVLRTITVKADYEFSQETVVNDEHIHSLDLIGVEKAYDSIREENNQEDIDFYCVGYSIIRYYLNDFSITNLSGHKAKKISVELLATFLPEEVINGLYTAVTMSDLQVANLTLEPIAAINVAIPEQFRLLNIALVDVGAGTSDISITKDGSIIAYGMIPYAGDEITELIAQKYLVEFKIAEEIKISSQKKKAIIYKDIMGLSQKVMPNEVLSCVSETIKNITKSIANKIIELNAGKSVSAVFVVGGGGKIPGFTKYIAEYLGLAPERVALRGEEVLKDVEFFQKDIKKDPLLVTPIGICLNFYDQKNNFIFVNVNGERIKLYDNNKLTITDAAIQVGFPNEKLFPRRGNPLNFTLNGKQKIIRGELGEAAVITLNGKEAGINSSIVQNDRIQIMESTIGSDATFEVRKLSEYNSIITFNVNGQKIICPKLVEANGNLENEFYTIKEGDNINILNYYTVEQLIEFMDVDFKGDIYVNNMKTSSKDLIYENFSVYWDFNNPYSYQQVEELINETEVNVLNNAHSTTVEAKTTPLENAITVIVNGINVRLLGKENYIFVDIFDFYPFDLSEPKGIKLITTINGQFTDYTTPLKEFDIIEVYWKE